MSKNVITTDAGESIQVVEKMMFGYDIHSLPVMDGGKLAGIITGGDIKRVSRSVTKSTLFSRFIKRNITVVAGDIMTKNVKTVSLLNTISETIDIFLKSRILGVPVVDENRDMIGIITKTDIFHALISLTSMNKKGVDIGFQVEDRPGSIKEITDVIRLHGGRIASILASYERATANHRNVYIKIYDVDRHNLTQIREKLLKMTVLHYIVDPSEQIRELF